MTTMDPVQLDSTSLAAAAHDRHRHLLQLQFCDGSVYHYFGVTDQTYHELLTADSKGAYFNRCIRGRYPYAASPLTQ